MNLHVFIDREYGPDGDRKLSAQLQNSADINLVAGPFAETPLLVAIRRRRLRAAEILLDHGAEINAQNKYGKSGFAHAVRRGFDEVAAMLRKRGADTSLNEADQLALAVVAGDLEQAGRLLILHPGIVKTGNPEEDRLLADLAGRNESKPVEWLIQAGADLSAKALEGGTALHQAAWFGQPENARLLIAAGAPLNGFDNDHKSSPLGWAVHGARYSGGSKERARAYEDIVQQLLSAGSQLTYPEDQSDAYFQRLIGDAPRAIKILLRSTKH